MLVFPMRSTKSVDGLLIPGPSVEGQLRSRIDALGTMRSRSAGAFEISRLPGTARVLVIPEGTRVSARIRNRYYDRLPDVAIVGPSSQPVTLQIDGTAPVEIPLSPLDWSRLTAVVAATMSDRIVGARDLGITCLDDVADFAMADLDTARSDGADSDVADSHVVDLATRAIARLAEAVVARDMTSLDVATTTLIAELMALIDAGSVDDAATAASQLATTPHNLRRIALRWFGFPPKTLLMRRRFIAALERFQETGMDFATITNFGYFDASHFLRDANRFLGTTPRRYLRRIDK
ncbi:helix-turn-helix domain-containing protein [Sphingomonas sp. LB3N6]|uniref:helix-turn-helix domain-containing protein n=1 Tax=Sphingomonas fucosidasi TaxID=3096164 RepID=UPI002FC80444